MTNLRSSCQKIQQIDQIARTDGRFRRRSMKKKFPLHHTVFRQSSSLLCHEGNVEQVFSIAQHNSDPNMRPSMLRLLTKTGINKSKYKPTVAAIWKRYQEKYKGLATCFNSESDVDSDLDSSQNSDSDSE